MPPGKVTPSAVAWREQVTCRNTMVLNRPWPGQLIDRIYYLLYFKSLSGSCPESRRVFDRDCPLGWVCRACQQSCWEQTRPAGAESRKAASPPLGRGQAPLRGGQSKPGSSPWPLDSLAPKGWRGLGARSVSVQPWGAGLGWCKVGVVFRGNMLLAVFTDRKAPNLAVSSLKTVSNCRLFLPDSDLTFQ